MTALTHILSQIISSLSLLQWRDICEILFFSCAFYYFSLWLNRDRNKKLLPAVYAYCGTIALGYALQLPTLTSFLLSASPYALILLILVHQDTLQKNFISLHKVTPLTPQARDWPEVLVQVALVALNKGREINGVIEKSDAMSSWLTSKFTLHAPLEYEILNLLIDSSSFAPHKLIWLATDGTLIGINADWTHKAPKEWLGQDVQRLSENEQAALFYTSKTDALMFKTSTTTRTFTLISHGKMMEDVSASTALKLIRHHNAQPSSHKGTASYEHNHQKETGNQPSSEM